MKKLSKDERIATRKLKRIKELLQLRQDHLFGITAIGLEGLTNEDRENLADFNFTELMLKTTDTVNRPRWHKKVYGCGKK